MSTRYASYSEGRAHFKLLLDAAHRGRAATVSRGANETAAVVNAAKLRSTLAQLVPRPVTVAENDGWSIFLPGVPVAADGDSIDEAIAEFLAALREYAADWQDRLYLAPNRENDWG
ncbi:MAG: prevent-host-death protein, partial [Angustibacter sp.]